MDVRSSSRPRSPLRFSATLPTVRRGVAATEGKEGCSSRRACVESSMTTRRGRCSTRTQLGENKRQAARRSRVTWAFPRSFGEWERDRARGRERGARDRGVDPRRRSWREKCVTWCAATPRGEIRDDSDARLGRSGYNSAKKKLTFNNTARVRFVELRVYRGSAGAAADPVRVGLESVSDPRPPLSPPPLRRVMMRVDWLRARILYSARIESTTILASPALYCCFIRYIRAVYPFSFSRLPSPDTSCPLARMFVLRVPCCFRCTCVRRRERFDDRCTFEEGEKESTSAFV